MTNTWSVLTTGMIFFIVGLICIFFPKKIQDYAIRVYENGKGLAKFNPFINYIRKPSYLISLRIIGVLSLMTFGFLIYLLITI